MTITALRIRLAEWLVPDSHSVVDMHVLQTILDINSAYAVRLTTQAMQVVPELFEAKAKPERLH